MREKTCRTVCSFYTTADAMAFEKAAMAMGIAGRLMPTPREISADCGFAWASDCALKQALQELILREGLQVEEMRDLMLY